jgi:adenylate kinase
MERHFGAGLNVKIFVGGVSGVGKSTFVGALALASRGFHAVRTSELMFDEFNLQRGDYQALRALASDAKDAAMESIVNSLLEKAERERINIVVDAHYLNFTGAASRRAVGPWICRFDSLIVLEAQPVEILRRIRADTWRVDRYPHRQDGEELKDIAEALALTRAEAFAMSETYGLPLLVIENSGELEDAVSHFLTGSAKFGAARD